MTASPTAQLIVADFGLTTMTKLWSMISKLVYIITFISLSCDVMWCDVMCADYLIFCKSWCDDDNLRMCGFDRRWTDSWHELPLRYTGVERKELAYAYFMIDPVLIYDYARERESRKISTNRNLPVCSDNRVRILRRAWIRYCRKEARSKEPSFSALVLTSLDQQ